MTTQNHEIDPALSLLGLSALLHQRDQMEQELRVIDKTIKVALRELANRRRVAFIRLEHLRRELGI